MTNREFFESVSKGELTEEVKTHAAEQIAKLDERNAKRSSKPSKTAQANVPIKADIVNLLTESGSMMNSPDIGVALGISTNKASALCRQLVDEGKLTVEERKVPKKGKMKFYGAVATATTEDEDEDEEQDDPVQALPGELSV